MGPKVQWFRVQWSKNPKVFQKKYWPIKVNIKISYRQIQSKISSLCDTLGKQKRLIDFRNSVSKVVFFQIWKRTASLKLDGVKLRKLYTVLRCFGKKYFDQVLLEWWLNMWCWGFWWSMETHASGNGHNIQDEKLGKISYSNQTFIVK